MKGYDYDEVSKGNKVLREQLEFYKKNDLEVHIEKNNNLFANGKVLEVNGDMLILNDRVLGAIPIHFIEIDKLEKFRKKEGEDGGK